MNEIRSRRPIFVVGNPRSGTTLLRLMLTCHRNIVVVPESGFSIWLADAYADWTWSAERLAGDFLPDLFRCRKIDTWGMDAAGLGEFIRGRRPDRYADLAGCVYVYYGLAAGRTFTRWGDKNGFYVSCVPQIRRVFPDCLLIHIVRDGRDVACSYRDVARRNLSGPYAPRLPTDINAIAKEWHDNLRAVHLARKSIPPDDLLEVRFEDLVLDPPAVLGRLCRFLDEEYDPGMLDYHAENASRQLEPPSLLGWKEKTLQPPAATAVGRHRQELADDERQSFQAIAGDLLAAYGYTVEPG